MRHYCVCTPFLTVGVETVVCDMPLYDVSFLYESNRRLDATNSLADPVCLLLLILISTIASYSCDMKSGPLVCMAQTWRQSLNSRVPVSLTLLTHLTSPSLTHSLCPQPTQVREATSNDKKLASAVVSATSHHTDHPCVVCSRRLTGL